MTIDIKKTPGSRRWLHLGGTLAAAGLVVAWACNVDHGEPDPCDPYRVSVAQSVAEHVLAPTFVEFETRAGELVTATEAWSAVAQAGGDQTAARNAAADAWRAAMLVWQRAELMQLGPAGSSAYVVGGEDLRDEIYSWPTVGPCRVDEELVDGGYGAPGFFDDALVNVEGLDAIEYLIFHDGPDNACDASAAINTEGTWNALGGDELARRRAAYAAAAAADVAALGERLSSAWGPGGDWADWLSRPDDDDSPYDDPSAAADGLMNAALYLDVRVKDRKLGAASSDLLESAFSARSKEHVLANLEGFRLVLLGGETPDQGYGFDDFLVALEEPELGAQMIAAVDEAVAAASAIDGSFEDALAADPGALVPVQDAVRRLTDLIKGPFVTTLKLSPPGEGAGDAD